MKNGVVIVTYNRRTLLQECIDCVLAQSVPFSNIIVVNNCSTDGTKEYLDSLHVPGGIFLHEEENLGGAGGFYEGMKVAADLDLDWVLIIDDDAMIAADYMEILLREAGVFGGAALSSGVKQTANLPKDTLGDVRPHALAGSVWTDGKLDLTHRRRIASRTFFVERPVPEKAYGQSHFSCDCATFCGLVLDGSTLGTIGLPKKDYFIWMDDTEYCLRLAPFGGITVVPAARLEHKTKLADPDQGLLMRTTWRHYYGYRNRLDTAGRHFGRRGTLGVSLEYHILSLCSRILMLRKSTRQKGAFNVDMIRDALRDGKTGKLGMNSKYHG
jgi:GT2 family glycosyltransferase